MRTLQELVLLLSETLSLWVRFFTRMGAWFCLGFAAHRVAMVTSAKLGSWNSTVATIVFILGVIASLVSLVLMIHAVERGLHSPREILRRHRASRPTEPPPIPPQVFDRESGLTVVAVALGPFLAVYALWGLVEDEVRQLFQINILLSGLGGTDNWSINFSRVTFYVVLAAAAWLTKQLLELGLRRRPTRWLAIPTVVADGIWVFASFLAIVAGFDRITDWLSNRVFWRVLTDGWRSFLGLLPDLRLPFDLTLPQALDRAAVWLWETGVPTFANSILLPLMWLALTATVFGWRRLSGRDFVTGTRFASAAEAMTVRAAALPGFRGPVSTVLSWATADLRTKYLPVLHSLRLVLRGGPRFLGAFLVLAALVRLGEAWLPAFLAVLPGPLPDDRATFLGPFNDLVTGLVFTTCSIALYAAAFDRSIAEAGGVEWHRRRVRRATVAEDERIDEEPITADGPGTPAGGPPEAGQGTTSTS